MPRWEPNAVGRLQEAAFELFERQGLQRTTVAEIARQADLTERTFYNHFATKADVLFGPRSERHQQVIVREISASDAALPPLEAVVHALKAAADELFDGLRASATRRRTIIDAHPALQEREDGKRAVLTAAIAAALGERGLDSKTALLTARVGVLVEQIAEETWTRSAGPGRLRDHLSEALHSLRAIVS